MVETVKPRASRAWLATWPKRPKPMISASPCRDSARSIPSIEGAARSGHLSASSTASGVSAMEMMTVAVSMAPVRASTSPAPPAAA